MVSVHLLLKSDIKKTKECDKAPLYMYCEMGGIVACYRPYLVSLLLLFCYPPHHVACFLVFLMFILAPVC